MSVLTIGILGIAGALLAVELKGLKGEYGIYLVAAVGLVIFFLWHHKIKDRDRDHPPGSELYPAEPDVSGGPVKNDRNYLYCGIFIRNL